MHDVICRCVRVMLQMMTFPFQLKKTLFRSLKTFSVLKFHHLNTDHSQAKMVTQMSDQNVAILSLLLRKNLYKDFLLRIDSIQDVDSFHRLDYKNQLALTQTHENRSQPENTLNQLRIIRCKSVVTFFYIQRGQSGKHSGARNVQFRNTIQVSIKEDLGMGKLVQQKRVFKLAPICWARKVKSSFTWLS